MPVTAQFDNIRSDVSLLCDCRIDNKKEKEVKAWFNGLKFALFGIFLAMSFQAQAADELNIDLELFNLDELEKVPDIAPVRGCSYALIQHDKDRWDSKYPFVFFQPLVDSPYPTEAYISVSGEFIALEEIATGGGENGDFPPYQFFRSFDGEYLVFLDLVVGEAVADIIEIDSGLVTVIATGKKPFRSRVYGAKGC